MMDNKGFNYTYSASTEVERRIVADIKKQYEPKLDSQSKVQRIKELDRKVKSIPMALSLTCGVLGTLIFGLGLTTVIEWNNLPLGLVVAVLGLPPVALAYPLHNRISDKLKKKYGPEIIELSNDILGE